jgi:hypothetical protein
LLPQSTDASEASLNIDLELRACRDFGLRAIAGRSQGIIAKGETVTWRTRQYGLAITHTTLLSELQYPTFFQDRMVEGFFGLFVHDHFFRSLDETRTEMGDEMRFTSPRWMPSFPFERWGDSSQAESAACKTER